MAERIREMAIGHQDLYVAKHRRDAYAAVRLSRAPDFACVGVPVILDHLTPSEAPETIDKIVGLVAREIDAIVRNRFERREIWRSEMPIKQQFQYTPTQDHHNN